MTVSKDRVRFHLPPRYFQAGRSIGSNGFRRDTMKRVLLRAFGIANEECDGLMDCSTSQGFIIECRPSQFARFIVYRHEANEGINGVRDLGPELVTATARPEHPYGRISRVLHLDVATVYKVARMLDSSSVDPYHEVYADIHVGDRFHEERHGS